MDFFSVLCMLIVCDSSHLVPLVDIPELGKVRGSIMTSAAGRNFYSFRSIRYAQPPVRQLRFRDPVRASPWVGKVIDATREGPFCIQFEVATGLVRGEEDCLILNIYTHDFDLKNTPRPVMVWIHGGAWSWGSGNGVKDMYGPRYLLDRNIVLVTINYRLGPLGFLSTEDYEAPGNYGLLDQVMALSWVRDNIKYFGGNSDLVTIFGQSAGAASVNLHLLSPLSKGLFHHAIAQSGSVLNPWVMQKTVGNYTKMLAKVLNCMSPLSSELVNCLQKKPARQIVLFRKQIESLLLFPVAFGPRVDIERKSPFLPADPRTLIEKKQINQVPTIFGLLENEGGYFVPFLVSPKNPFKKLAENPMKYLKFLTSSDFYEDGEIIDKQIASRFLSLNKPYENHLYQIEQIISDYMFFKGVDDFVKLLCKFSNQPTYYYFYKHRANFPILLDLKYLHLGVIHTDEVYLIFSKDKIRDKVSRRLTSPEDIKVSNMLLDLWASFATDGIPRSNLFLGDWIPVKENQTQYLSIDGKNPSMVYRPMPFYERLKFWSEVFPTQFLR